MRFSLVRWTQSQNEPFVPVVSLIIVKRRSGALLAATLTLNLLASIFEVSLGCVELRPKELDFASTLVKLRDPQRSHIKLVLASVI